MFTTPMIPTTTASTTGTTNTSNAERPPEPGTTICVASLMPYMTRMSTGMPKGMTSPAVSRTTVLASAATSAAQARGRGPDRGRAGAVRGGAVAVIGRTPSRSGSRPRNGR